MAAKVANGIGIALKWKIDDIPLYIAVVEKNGITAAAQQLDLPKSSISRAIGRLEDALGVRLLQRNSRSMRTTSEGEIFYQRCLRILEEVSDANAEMSELTSEPSGRLVVSMPIAFSREVFSPTLSKFICDYPKIDLEIVITSEEVDIISDNIDLAVMLGPFRDSELVAKHLIENRLVWVTSPRYMQNLESCKDIKVVASHIKVCETRYARNPRLMGFDTEEQIPEFQHTVMVNDPLVVRDALLDGQGVSILPRLYCKNSLSTGELIEVTPEIKLKSGFIAAVFPSRRHISNKVRVFVAFLQEILKDPPYNHT